MYLDFVNPFIYAGFGVLSINTYSHLNARLKLLYEQAGELRIESEEGIGTVLQIRVPFVRR